jgi:hypothetical protein
MKYHDWQCPSCGLRTEIASDRIQQSVTTLIADNAAGPRVFYVSLIVCPNRLCMQLEVSVAMHVLEEDDSGALCAAERPLKKWNLIPGPKGKQLPPYVPAEIAREYMEASQIMEISPNASATLARRCLQAIVRDFWGVKKTFLADELDEIKQRVDPETWDAIEAVRGMGNIGKHLEKGVNVVVDVEPDEPAALLGLIDYLVEDWYVARRRRQQRLEAIKNRSTRADD